MNTFYADLAEIMEVDKVQEEDVLRDFPEWDSLTVLSVIAMVHTGYGVALSADDLRQAVTAQALYESIGRKRKN